MLFLSTFFVFSSCEYFVLTTENYSQIIGGSKPSLVKFYSPNCPHCRKMEEDFYEAASAFTEVNFGGADCTKEKEICAQYRINGYPTILFFNANSNKSVTEYKGTRTSDDFCDFVENYTGIRAKRPKKVLLDLNPVIFDDYVNARKCTFMTFYAPWCGHCKKFLPEVKKVAQAFNEIEPNASVAIMNCDTYRTYCQRFEVKGFPTIRLFKDGEAIPFSGERTAESVADFINKNCGTARGADGLVSNVYGLIKEADELAQKFVEAEDKQSLIEQAKKIEGADFYVMAMERLANNGASVVKQNLETMKQLLDDRAASPATLDELKRRINILGSFNLL